MQATAENLMKTRLHITDNITVIGVIAWSSVWPEVDNTGLKWHVSRMKKKVHTPAGGLVESLIDEVLRLRGRVLSATRAMNESRGLSSHSQGLILSAVARAVEPPTVARIARSLDLTRQSVQRTANELADAGLVAFEDNPFHKRAKQLVMTPTGWALYERDADFRGQWADDIGAAVGEEALAQAVQTLRRMRKHLEHPDSDNAEVDDLS
ncbi:MarR family transcriptional regulator [Pandoraea apista]|nr:MarR family transcriptional regulator [Pandoraea apista]RRX01866.1 MarR family transcriptional regulator [Pandoraea apista]CFB65566.1 MarR family protein [Pandoraea apista]